MTSEDNELPVASSSTGTHKRARKSSSIPLESGHRCIASALSKVINNMVNKHLQQHCIHLLEVEDIKDMEARICYVLQQIDIERENEEKIKENAKKRRTNKKVKDNN